MLPHQLHGGGCCRLLLFDECYRVLVAVEDYVDGYFLPQHFLTRWDHGLAFPCHTVNSLPCACGFRAFTMSTRRSPYRFASVFRSVPTALLALFGRLVGSGRPTRSVTSSDVNGRPAPASSQIAFLARVFQSRSCARWTEGPLCASPRTPALLHSAQ